MRNFTVYITGGKVCLERIGNIAVERMIDGPHTGSGMQAFMSHEVLELSPMSTFGHPKAGIQCFQYIISFLAVRCGIFPYFFSNQSSKAVGTIVISSTVSYGTAVVVEGIACPDTGVGIVKTVIIGIIVELLPGKMTSKYRPYTTGIFQITGPVKMPQEFIYITKIHIIMMHLIVTTRITTNISVTVLRCTPLLYGTSQSKGRILCRMWYRIGYLSHLAGSIGIEMRTGTIVPPQSIACISCTPAAKGHTPTNGTMQPDFTIPNTIGSYGKGTTQGIKKWIGSCNPNAGSQFGTGSL